MPNFIQSGAIFWGVCKLCDEEEMKKQRKHLQNANLQKLFLLNLDVSQLLRQKLNKQAKPDETPPAGAIVCVFIVDMTLHLFQMMYKSVTELRMAQTRQSFHIGCWHENYTSIKSTTKTRKQKNQIKQTVLSESVPESFFEVTINTDINQIHLE